MSYFLPACCPAVCPPPLFARGLRCPLPSLSAQSKASYLEHWRHVQYDKDYEIAERFFESPDYKEYVAAGGTPFSSDIFLQSKCFCIEQSTFSECACPTCTLMQENLRMWDRLRRQWYAKCNDKEGAEACACGHCEKNSVYRKVSLTPSPIGRVYAPRP